MRYSISLFKPFLPLHAAGWRLGEVTGDESTETKSEKDAGDDTSAKEAAICWAPRRFGLL